MRTSFGLAIAAYAGSLIVINPASVLAADIARPVYKAAAALIPFSWTGLYIGGHIGWGGADRVFDQTVVGNTVIVNPGFTQNPDGFIGGGQIGFNQQISNWIWGLEVDFSGANLGERTTAVSPPTGIAQTYDVSIDWTATLTGRLGYSWDRWMVYGKGGAALMRETYALTAPGLVIPDSPYRDAKVVRLGWTLGAGIENAFTDNWSWKIEYNYMRFDGNDSISNTLSGVTSVGITSLTEVDLHVVKAGINYRLREPANVQGVGSPSVYKAAPMLTALDWTGLYVGGHVGWASANRDVLTTVGVGGGAFTPGFTQTPDGFIGGGQIGFNRQMGNWVLGLEADVSATGLSDTTSVIDSTATIFQTFDVKIDWLATLAGRIGYAWDRWMVYGKGGAATMHETYALVSSPVVRNDANVTRLGWVVAAGIENAFLDNWSWKAEYNYMKFDDIRAANTNETASAAGRAIHSEADVHLVKLGVNYRFGNYGKNPVIAKY